VKYITQVSANPVSFVLFVNRKKGFPKEYVQYLINGIRKEFGFTWVPISIETREQ
jgi:GTP-binding protein